MPVPYSNDLRLKVISLIKQGKKQTEISRLLEIDNQQFIDGIKNLEFQAK